MGKTLPHNQNPCILGVNILDWPIFMFNWYLTMSIIVQNRSLFSLRFAHLWIERRPTTLATHSIASWSERWSPREGNLTQIGSVRRRSLRNSKPNSNLIFKLQNNKIPDPELMWRLCFKFQYLLENFRKISGLKLTSSIADRSITPDLRYDPSNVVWYLHQMDAQLHRSLQKTRGILEWI